MPRYVKIKKSKNLRFKLISLMYLIFLVLSVIQIPIGWLKITPYIQTYLSKPKLNTQDTSLSNYLNTLNKVDNDFKIALGYNEASGLVPEINSYSITDEFFIDNANGQKLFSAIQNLKVWAESLPNSDARKKLFYDLFIEDLSNGVDKNNPTSWTKYRWKHVPAGLALNLIEEMKLRVKLLNTGNVEEVEQTKEPAFTLMTEYASMRVGDEATLTTKGDTLESLVVLRDNKPTNDFTINGNNFIVKPKFAGTYLIQAKGKSKQESMTIEVLPAGFPSKEALPFRICYMGVPYSQTIPFHGSGLSLDCSSDPQASLNTGTGKINFKPQKLGWCKLKVSQKEGVLFFDSVFVKQLPEPNIQVKGLISNSIARKRLLQSDKFTIEAFHPSFDKTVFNVVSFNKRSVGKITTITKISGNEITIDQNEKYNMKYLIIYDVEVKMGTETKKIEQPIIIQII